MGLRFFALACLVGAAFAGPLEREGTSTCSKKCHRPSHPKFDWKIGKTYVYQYRSNNTLTYMLHEKQQSKMEAILDFHVVSTCDVILKIKNIRISQKLSEKEEKELIEKLELPLTFSHADQRANHICPSPHESTQSINMKKSIISAFVNSMTKLDTPQEIEERDSLGTCLTKYGVIYDHGLVITKEKDTSTCSHRHALLTPFFRKDSASPFFLKEDVLSCKQYIENKIMKKVECDETQIVAPPMKDTKDLVGFKGHIVVELIEIRSSELMNSQLFEAPLIEQDILYSLEESRDGDHENEVEEILTKLCKKENHVIDFSVSGDFVKLVSGVKRLNYETLRKFYQSLKNGEICSKKVVRDMFCDTLPMVGTNAAMKLMVELLESKEITGIKAKLWPLSFALTHNPTEETMKAIVPLLKVDTSVPVMLGVSALVHRYCSSNKCDHSPGVNAIVSLLHKDLGRKCSGEDDKVLRVLKAFSNMGYHGKTKEDIVSCAEDKYKSTRIRLAAIDSFRRIDEPRPEKLIEMYSDTNEDYEIRIACFATSIKKADGKQLRKIRETAEKETDEQVSSYVYTFFQNVNKTSIPKQNNRELLTKMSMNIPKNSTWGSSKYFTFGSYSEQWKLGGSLEADIIHSPDSKFPRAVYGSFNAKMFGTEVNLLQMGGRMKGVEELVRKFIGSKENAPEKKSNWNFFGVKDMIGESDSEASFYVRTLDTEIMDFSASDLSGIAEMMKVAELVNKLSSGRNADFSHSFMFLNSKLLIPSVTGKSYSIDFVGSSTVGLKARTKVDVLSLPKNADVQFSIQPKMNIEISSTIGIQSNRHRPDVKILSRGHMEADWGVNFRVEDGHVAIAKLDIPSENIVMGKVSTDVIKINADHTEEPYFPKMQKKMDYCIRTLHKPLGLSACTTIEVAKPFVTRNFPILVFVGNAEFAIKKTDDTCSSYEARIEIPKHSGPVMKYSASLDTPGSRISRRFAMEMELKKNKHQKELSVQLVSPFKSYGLAGSYVFDNKLIQATVELGTESEKLLSGNITVGISSSRSSIEYKASSSFFVKNIDPVKINGSFSIFKGKKYELKYDLKSNLPISKPVSLKGFFVKDGEFSLSKKTDLKLSSRTTIVTPYLELDVRKTAEHKFKKSEFTSVNLVVDYKREGEQKKNTVTISGTTQKRHGKTNGNVKFLSTVAPNNNYLIAWNTQNELKDTLKQDLTVKTGPELEELYLVYKMHSHFPVNRLGETNVTIDIPNHSDFFVKYDLQMKHQLSPIFELHVKVDLLDEDGGHIKGGIHAKREFSHTKKFFSKNLLELDFPEIRWKYEDEIKETSKHGIEGKSEIKQDNKSVVKLKFKYHRLSDNTKFHQEFEGSLLTPFSPNLIKGKASLKISRESMAVEGQLGSGYSILAHLNHPGVLDLSFQSPFADLKLNAKNEVHKKSFDLDVKLKLEDFGLSHHLILTSEIELREKTSFKLEIVPYADEEPDKKILITTVLVIHKNNSNDMYSSSTKIKIFDKVDVTLTELGSLSLTGNQEFTLDASINNSEPISLTFRREVSNGQSKTTVIYSRNNSERLKGELGTKLRNSGNKRELSIKSSLTSPNPAFEDIHLHFSQRATYSGASTIMQSLLSLKKNEKVYRAEMSSDFNSNGLEMNAKMQSPIEKYENHDLSIAYRRSESGISSSVAIKTLDDKHFSLSSEFKKKSHGFSVSCSMTSPFVSTKDVKAEFNIDNHPTYQSVESYLAINNETIGDLSACSKSSSSGSKIEGNLKLSNLPYVKCRGVAINYETTESSSSFSSKVELPNDEEISLSLDIKEESDSKACTANVVTPFESMKDAKVHISVGRQLSRSNLLFYIDMNKERKCDAEVSITSSPKSVEMQGRLKAIRYPEMSAHLKCEKSEETYSVTANVLKGTSPLLHSCMSYTCGEKLQMKTKSFENTILDFNISAENSESNSKKLSLRASGAVFPPIYVTVFKSEKNPLNVGILACMDEHKKNCYSLRFHNEVRIHPETNGYYQENSMDIEKITGGYSIHIGNVTFLVSESDNDFKTKVAFKVKNKTVGFEINLDKRATALDCYVYLPQRTSALRSSFLEKNGHMNFKIAAIPNIKDSENKYGFEMEEEIKPSNEIRTTYKMNYPEMVKPLVTCVTQEVRNTIVGLKCVVQSDSRRGKTLTAEMIPDRENGFVVYTIYSEDKSLDASFKVIQKSSSEKDEIGYEWKYSSPSDHRKGGAIVTLYDKKYGSPKSMKIAYYSPSSEYEVLGSVANAPEDASLSLASVGSILAFIKIKTSDSCLNMEITNSGQTVKSSLCIKTNENNSLPFITAEFYHREQKKLDLRIGVDPDIPTFVDVDLKWKTADILRAMSEVSGWDSIFPHFSIWEWKRDVIQIFSNIKNYIKDKLVDIKNDILQKLVKIKDDIIKKLVNIEDDTLKKLVNIKDNILKTLVNIKDVIMEKISQRIESILSKLKKIFHLNAFEAPMGIAKSLISHLFSYISSLIPWDYFKDDVVQPLIKTVNCFVKENIQFVKQHIPDFLKMVLAGTKTQFEHCLKKFCIAGTFCHQIIKSESFDEAKDIFYKKFSEARAGFVIDIPTFNLANLGNLIHSGVKMLKDQIDSVFGQFLGDTILHQIARYAKKLEGKVRQKIINLIDEAINNMNNLFNQDEDYRILKDIVNDRKEKVMHAWRNKEEIAENSFRHIKEKFMNKIRKMIHGLIQIIEFDSEKGILQFRFRQPLGPSEIKIMKNELRTLE
ncbi:vitellogenin, partial [Caerostris darwini]